MSDGAESILLSCVPNLVLLKCSGLVYQSSIHKNSGRALISAFRPVLIGVDVIRA